MDILASGKSFSKLRRPTKSCGLLQCICRLSIGKRNQRNSKKVDLSEDDTVFSFDGKEISKETMRKAIAIAKALEENE